MHTRLLKHSALALAFAVTLAGCGKSGQPAGDAAAENYDLWIRGGTVIDGTGAPGRMADVLVRGDEIVFVGTVDPKTVKAKETIDATGKTITPGFIDAHAHGDPLKSALNNFLLQGYTTVVLGQDGVTAGETDTLKTGDEWRAASKAPTEGGDAPGTLAQWMNAVDKHGSEVNIAPLSGQGSLRAIAGVGSAPKATPEQLEFMKEILRADMAAGSFGMSSGLEYDPGRYSSPEETKTLGDVVGEQGGVVMSHMRTEDTGKIGKAVAELLLANAHVHVSHMKIVAGIKPEEAKAVLDQMEKARASGKQVTGDVYPWLASASNLVFLYPDWAKKQEDYNKAVKTRRAELEKHIIKRVNERLGPQAILITEGKWAGKRVSEVAEELHKPYIKVMIDDLGYGGPPQAHFLMSPQVHEQFIYADHVSISTDGAPGISHPRSAGSTSKILEEYVGPAPKMSIERAIFKMSGLPAKEVLGLKDRGTLVQGAKADILVLNLPKVHTRATWSEPQLPPEGFDVVIVNGQIAARDGKPEGKHGKVLHHEAPAAAPAPEQKTQ